MNLKANDTTETCIMKFCSGKEDLKMALKKTVKKTHKFKAHDELNACGVGDKVRIVETRKLSKDKNWRVAEIVEKAK